MNIKLTDLEAVLVRYDKNDEGVFHKGVADLKDAQGVRFLCPKCFAKNGGATGTHAVVCWSSSRGVPPDAQPGPGRWALEGTSIEDLTLGCEPGKSRSVQLIGGCKWHGFVTNGWATEA